MVNARVSLDFLLLSFKKFTCLPYLLPQLLKGISNTLQEELPRLCIVRNNVLLFTALGRLPGHVKEHSL